ncbi:MAG: hypothetical protein M3319_13305, partial [Actinomycetota bacterium]|nr:hypothetical protein [Actinomycetota bacterium]MDQ3901359.1 hypothetical protein [Actinomycetota bacterium]
GHGSGSTTKRTTVDLDAPKAAASKGMNSAVTWYDATDSLAVIPDTVPSMTGAGSPRALVPSLNCMSPAATVGVTVAVNLTGVLAATGDGGEVLNEVLVTLGGIM